MAWVAACVPCRQLFFVSALLVVRTAALSVPARAPSYGTAVATDQAAYTSDAFWELVSDGIPGVETDPALERFRGFVHNLRTAAPGEVITRENGQELLAQYVFPGIDDDRTPFPDPGVNQLEQTLTELAPVAREELDELLRRTPLTADDGPRYEGEEDEGWNRAAWYGWQFMSLRDAKSSMPKTIRALADGVPLAHRFIGVARQRRHCRGTLHSDQRNYLLSTLVGLRVPTDGVCGLVVPGGRRGLTPPAISSLRVARDSQFACSRSPCVGTPPCADDVPGGGDVAFREDGVIVLDNTFPHYVYNDCSKDRFVLMTVHAQEQ